MFGSRTARATSDSNRTFTQIVDADLDACLDVYGLEALGALNGRN
jgi:hypothetical protein